MTDNPIECKRAEILSDFIDQLNSGEDVSLDNHVEKLTKGNEAKLKPLIETAIPLRHAVMFKPLSAERKKAVFTRVQSELAKTVAGTNALSADALPVTQRTDILILLLHQMRQIWGNIKLMKMPFLLAKEGGCASFVQDFYGHQAYSYGAFDKLVLSDVDELFKMGIVDKKTVFPKKRRPGEELGIPDEKQVDAVYQLTLRGKAIAERLTRGAQTQNPAILANIQRVIQQHGSKTSDQLLSYTYNKYRESAEKSKVRDKYLKNPDQPDADSGTKGGQDD